MCNISVYSCLLAKLHTSLDRSTFPGHLNYVPHPVCPSPPMSLVSLTLFTPPLPCLWFSSPCLPLPSHVFGVPHPVYPSPPMSLVFLPLFAPPLPCLWCPSPCLPLPSHVFGALLLCLPLPSHVFGVTHPVCPSHPMSLVHPLLCLPTLHYLSQPTHLHCMVSSDLSWIFHHLVNYSDHLPLPYI